MIFVPSEFYRRAFKRGMSGWDVAAIQMTFNGRGAGLAVDGIFGEQTEVAVKRFQANRGLTIDGICGIATQRELCVVEGTRAEGTRGPPRGLLRGLIEGESGYVIPATTPPYSDGRRDLGPCQFNTDMNDQQAVERAFNLRWACDESARRLRESYNDFQRPGLTVRQTWECAVLNHNWPSAAAQYAAGTFDSWRYAARDENGVLRTYGVDDAAYWIQRIGVANVTTARQWVWFYVESKTHYVNW